MNEQIWGALYDADRLNRYYEKLADRYRKLYFWLNMAIAVGSLVAALTFFADLPRLASACLFVLVSAGVIWVTFAEYARKAAAAETASAQCGEIRTALARIWRGLDTMEDEAARVTDFERRLENATYFVRIDTDEELNKSCSKRANELLQAEFAR